MAQLSDTAVVDANEVKEILETDLTTDQLNAFINMAVALLAPVKAAIAARAGAAGYKQIELLVAAHLSTMRERTVKSKSVGGQFSVTFMGKDGLGLNSSLYGQQALVLDGSGSLASLGKRRVKFHVTTYEDVKTLNVDDD